MSIQDSLTFKFLMMGDTGVGKTSLVRRLCRDEFSNNMDPTIGIGYEVYKLTVSDTKIQMQIWDTAGQEQYRSLVQSYYRDAVGVIVVFSFNNHKSFEGLEEWIADARNYCHPKVRILLVGNKIDLESERTVSKAEIEQFAKYHKLEYVETSAKTNTNVKEVFHKAARNVFQSVVTNEIHLGPQNEGVNVDIKKREMERRQKEESGCC